MLNKPEILAPAGTFTALQAAVNAGADAIYLGGDLFSARAFAGNFDTKSLTQAIHYCHIKNVKLYMAVNTLLKNSEISNLISYMTPFYKEGLDGVIVQDMGVFSCLNQAFPYMPIHGSTQMSITSKQGAAYLKKLGFTRFVPAREISLSEISAIKNSVDIEVETFVHGAMCFSYSGKCFMSSFAGGRSGNRGRCAQICRKCYSGENFSDKYALSMKDMCTLSNVGDLIDAGIDSFKIEGRMKKPEYVAATAMAYKEVRDAYLGGNLEEKLVDFHVNRLMDIYNRGGFSSGYYYMKNGSEMLATARPNHTGNKVGKVVKVAPPKVHIALTKDVNKGDVLALRGTSAEVELTSGDGANKGATLVINGNNFGKINKGMPVYRMKNKALVDSLNADVIAVEKVQKVEASFTAVSGKNLSLTLSIPERDVEVTVFGAEVYKAQKAPVTAEQIKDKLSKTGGTGFTFAFIGWDVSADAFVPMGAVNELRRCGVEELAMALVEKGRRGGDWEECVAKLSDFELGKMQEGSASVGSKFELSGEDLDEIDSRKIVIQDLDSKKFESSMMQENNLTENIHDKLNDAVNTFVSINSTAHLNILNNSSMACNIIMDYNVAKELPGSQPHFNTTYIALPEVTRDTNIQFTKEAISFATKNSYGALIKNMDQLGLLKEVGFAGPVIFDSLMYCYNTFAINHYLGEFPHASFLAPAELTESEIRELEKATNSEIIRKAYGYQPVMVTAQNLPGVENTPFTTIKDTQGNAFHVTASPDSASTIIYNGVPTDNRDKYNINTTSLIYDFTIETEEQMVHILNNTSLKTFTRGHYTKGID